MDKSYFNNDIKRMSEEDPLRTLGLFLKYNFPISEEEFEIIKKNAEAFDYFKTHKILIEFGKEKLDKEMFMYLLDEAEKDYSGTYTQMLVLFEIGKQYIEQNDEIDYTNDEAIKRLIKLSPISLNLLGLPTEVNYEIYQSLKNTNDVELVASLLKAECVDEESFVQIKRDLIETFKQTATKEDYKLLEGTKLFDMPGHKFDIQSKISYNNIER